jgi:Ni2+-binding GTPase involved in maturation of urease and hydrogenase
MKLEVKPIPVSGHEHPSPPHDMLPRHEFSMGFIAPKGAGKTTTLINLLRFYKGYFHTIVIFSPTVKNDEKWDWYLLIT